MVGSWIMIFGGVLWRVLWWGFVVVFFGGVWGWGFVGGFLGGVLWWGFWGGFWGGVLWWGIVVGFEVVGLSYHNRVSTTHYRFFYNRYPTQPVPPALTVWG